MSPGFLFAVLSFAGLIGVMVRGFLAGGPRIAIGLGVAIGIPVCTSLILFETLGWFSWGLPLLMAAGLAFGFGVARARLRSPAYRWLVTLPGSAFGAAGWLAIPWAYRCTPYLLRLCSPSPSVLVGCRTSVVVCSAYIKGQNTHIHTACNQAYIISSYTVVRITM